MLIYDVANLSQTYSRSFKNEKSALSTFCKSENVNLEHLLYTLTSLKRK